jgi:hypothetical protein
MFILLLSIIVLLLIIVGWICVIAYIAGSGKRQRQLIRVANPERYDREQRELAKLKAFAWMLPVAVIFVVAHYACHPRP